MIHVALKIGVWLCLLGVFYLVFGPQAFDSSNLADPLQNASSRIYLPPTKPPRLVELENRLHGGGLQADETSEFRSLAREYQGRFWKGDGVTVEQALSGVREQRRQRLLELLKERGLTDEEVSVFWAVLNRDHPAMLADRDQ